jgi:hypothetical protein
LWEGVVGTESITLLSALWKCGKTTLLSHLLRGFAEGGEFCGTRTVPAKVLYLTEEHESFWAERRDELGIGDHVELDVQPFLIKPTFKEWIEYLNLIHSWVKRGDYVLVVFDTISALWPVNDENNAAEVAKALLPLRAIAALAAILLVHHLKKSDGQEATGSRGSGALTAFVDTIIELRRVDAADRGNRQRILTGHGRHRDTLEEIVIELAEDGHGYTAMGTKAEAGANEVRDKVLSLLPPAESEGMTIDQIEEAWPGPGAGVRRQTLCHALRAGVDTYWRRAGTGKKGKPFRYWGPVKPMKSHSVPDSSPRGKESETESYSEPQPLASSGLNDGNAPGTEPVRNSSREPNQGDAYEGPDPVEDNHA